MRILKHLRWSASFRSALLAALRIGAAAFVALAVPAMASAQYTFTNIVDSTGPFKAFMPFGPSLNNSRAVAFWALRHRRRIPVSAASDRAIKLLGASRMQSGVALPRSNQWRLP